MRELGLTRIRPECLAVAPRRFGKTVAVSVFNTAMLMHCPSVQILVFSTGQRASTALNRACVGLLEYAGASDRIVKNTDEQVRELTGLEYSCEGDLVTYDVRHLSVLNSLSFSSARPLSVSESRPEVRPPRLPQLPPHARACSPTRPVHPVSCHRPTQTRARSLSPKGGLVSLCSLLSLFQQQNVANETTASGSCRVSCAKYATHATGIRGACQIVSIAAAAAKASSRSSSRIHS